MVSNFDFYIELTLNKKTPEGVFKNRKLYV